MLANAGQFLLDVGQPLLRIRVVFFFQRLLFDFQLRGVPFELVDFRGHGIDLDAQRGGGFVDQVDGLVGQEAVGNIAMRQGRGCNNGGVFDAHAMVHLVFFLQPAQNGNRVFDVRLAHENDLEAAFERGVFLDVLAIFVERGGADGAQSPRASAGFSMFEASMAPSAAPAPTRVCSSSMKRMICPLRVFDFFQHGLEAVFEFAAIFRAGQHGSQIERHDALVLQDFGHVAGDDALRQALDDGRLAHAGLADQHRIIFRAPREHLHDAANFFVASDDGIEFAAPRLLVQIAGVALQRLVLGFGILVGDALRSADRGERLQNGVVGRAVARQQLLRRIALQAA